MPTATFPKNNNLDWLRLAFATQVVVEHAARHLGFSIPRLIGHFPGVPAFFFVSGFLIYASYLNAPGRQYLENRLLRLFPGLVFVTFGGAAVVLVAHGWRDLFDHYESYALWFVSQVTLGQAYNPALFRDVGSGVINGSLWTLTTEILYYLCVPLIVWLERRLHFAVLVLMALSLAVYCIGPVVWTEPIYRDKTLYDLLALTPIAWGWMFGFGILAVKHFELLRRQLRLLPWLAIPLAAMVMFGDGLLFGSTDNRLGLLYFACYVGLVLWFAFATPFLRLTFDLSYGTYVWHMPVINLLLVLAVPSVALALTLTAAVAALSWFLVERPALRLKRRSLKPVDAPAPTA